jgi:SAM-dependent methyltransferase
VHAALLDALPVASQATCPACGGRELYVFYEQQGVPVHSCRLVASREEAESFPTGSLELGLCPACGFITNVAHDPSLQSYFESYEETQGFSPHFQKFMRSLARRWVERYDLRGKQVLEIGCGKGEFLLAMCEFGAGHGIGIDPAVVLERVIGPAANRVQFIRDLYSDAYAHLTGDAVVCRHTLEHIGAVGEFMSTVRRSLDERPHVVVLFELPDAMRVLRDCAFWDVYYEHCSYFTPGSLARLFRSSGLDVLSIELDYDDQYILIEGRPDSPRTAPSLLEEPPNEVVRAAMSFRNGLAQVQRRWRDELQATRESGRKAVIWGAGSKGVAFITTLGLGDEIGCVVDVNPYKHGMFMAGTGHEIVPPEALRKYRPDLVIAMNPVYLVEIRSELERLGVDAQLAAVSSVPTYLRDTDHVRASSEP